MAENKKSFIAYSSWHEMFKELPDDVAGVLIKHMFAYVNDENPQSDDYIINALFGGIRPMLKRDLERWEQQKKQRSEAGKKSAKIRATKSNERLTVVNEKERNPTDNVNVNVNDNVIVNENDNKIKEVTSPAKQDDPIDFDSLLQIYHETCTKLPKVKKLTDARKKAVRARVKEHGKEAVRIVLTKVSKDPFYNGDNDRNWVADFDFIFTASKFVKILEKGDTGVSTSNNDIKEKMRKLREERRNSNANR